MTAGSWSGGVMTPFPSERGARNVMSELSAEQTRLAQLWEEHMRHEFQTCSTEDTLATMVEDAYVNHVPVPVLHHALHPEDATGHGDDAAVTHHRDRPAGRRNGRGLDPYGGDGLDAAGDRAHRKAGRNLPPGRCRRLRPMGPSPAKARPAAGKPNSSPSALEESCLR